MKKNAFPSVVLKAPVQKGKWVYKPLRSVIVVCACGNKYIVTRSKQTQCLNCIYGKTFVKP